MLLKVNEHKKFALTQKILMKTLYGIYYGQSAEI